MRWKLHSGVGWLVAVSMLGVAGVLLWFVQLRQSQRAESLRSLDEASFVEPTLPPFVIDRMSNVPLATSAARQPAVSTTSGSLLAQTALLPTPASAGIVIEPLQTPESIELLDPTASLSIPYVRDLDLLLNQDGKEQKVLTGRPQTATQSAVTYAYPLISPNGTLVAFFEWIEPIRLGELATARQVVLKVLDITTSKIRTTPYRFPQLRHDLDGGLPVKWNSRNFLEIEQQSTALNATHVLYDPDRNVVMAENNLRAIAHTPWKDRTAVSVLPGFTLSPDGQWRMSTNEQQFIISPVGSDKVLPVVISEIKEGHLVRFYGWFYGSAYFEVEKKDYAGCTQKAMAQPQIKRIVALTTCFLDAHYLIAVDPTTQQITRRWYNYQVGMDQDVRWLRLVWFLNQAVLNHKNEVIFMQPKVPLIYSADQPLHLTTAPSGQVAVVITKEKIEIWRGNDERNEVTIEAPLSMTTILSSAYRFMWTGNERYLVLYPNDYQRTSEQSIIKIDTQTKKAEKVTGLGRSWFLP